MKLRLPELLIVFGCALFIFALWYSAKLDPSIRWLHFFQAWMYLATVALSLRQNPWGYFIGVSIAGFWDYLNLFVTTFLRSGLRWLGTSIASGHLRHPDQVIGVPAWIGNLLIVIGCVWAYGRLSRKSPADLLRLAAAFIGTLAFLVADIALCQPRYLPLFTAMFHPHQP